MIWKRKKMEGENKKSNNNKGGSMRGKESKMKCVRV
jgi:hypothetical protein